MVEEFYSTHLLLPFLKSLPVTLGVIDFDGVIVDSEPLQKESYKVTLEKFQVDGSNLDFKSLIGKNEFTIWKEIKKIYGLNVTFDELHNVRSKILHSKVIAKKPNWFILSILEHFDSLKGSILVSSGNGKLIQDYLYAWHLGDFFSDFFMSNDSTQPIEKSKILKNIIIGTEHIPLVVEDSLFYATQCKNSGAYVFWVKHSLNEQSTSEAIHKDVDAILHFSQ